MDRRDLLATLGVLGAGAAVGARAPAAAQQAEKKAAEGAHAATPVGASHAHFCGIHIAKNNPKFQVVTQHYCVAHPGDGHGGGGLFQCLLYDKTGPGAKLLGVEYIIGDEQYRALPDEEKKYWHVHSYEVLGGGLIAPSMPEAEEKAFMKGLLTTWGKAWHTWPDPSTAVPLGEPLLIWSLTSDGQVDPDLVAARDREFGVSTDAIAARRQAEIGLKPPQVAPPASMDSLGRQWTNEGDDKPTPLP
jgi:hypothetical protein